MEGPERAVREGDGGLPHLWLTGLRLQAESRAADRAGRRNRCPGETPSATSNKEKRSISAMATFSLKVIDRNDSTICVSSGEDFVDLVCMRAYEEGDRIVLETSDKNAYVNWQVDDALGAAFVYITDNVS